MNYLYALVLALLLVLEAKLVLFQERNIMPVSFMNMRLSTKQLIVQAKGRSFVYNKLITLSHAFILIRINALLICKARIAA